MPEVAFCEAMEPLQRLLRRHLADEDVIRHHESERVLRELNDQAVQISDSEALSIAEFGVKVFGPAGVLDLVLPCEHALYACDGFAGAYSRRVS